jgi:hypothetical protein
MAGSVRALLVLPRELPVAVERIQAEGKLSRKMIARLQSELAVHETAAHCGVARCRRRSPRVRH